MNSIGCTDRGIDHYLYRVRYVCLSAYYGALSRSTALFVFLGFFEFLIFRIFHFESQDQTAKLHIRGAEDGKPCSRLVMSVQGSCSMLSRRSLTTAILTASLISCARFAIAALAMPDSSILQGPVLGLRHHTSLLGRSLIGRRNAKSGSCGMVLALGVSASDSARLEQ